VGVVVITWTKESETRYWMVTQLCSATLERKGNEWHLTAKRDGVTKRAMLSKRALLGRAEDKLVEWGWV
jgi:hypothetical protein